MAEILANRRPFFSDSRVPECSKLKLGGLSTLLVSKAKAMRGSEPVPPSHAVECPKRWARGEIAKAV